MTAVVGCGGIEPGLVQGVETQLHSAGERGVAPAWMAELDLPGCECLQQLSDAQRQRVRLLGHPLDPALVIASVDGDPTCVGTEPLDAFQAVAPTKEQPTPGLKSTSVINPAAQVLPEDDPVPIRPEDAEQGQQGGSSSNQGAEESGTETKGPGVVLQISVSDDPVPIRDTTPLAPHLTLSSD